MEEQWKEIYGFNVLYEISNLGRVRTKYTKGKVYCKDYNYLIPVDNGNGYLKFNWKSKNKNHTVYLHRLVAEAFIDNPKGYKEVNHIDEDKTNNCVNNLEWCDHQYNSKFGTKNERAKKKRQRDILCIDTGIIYHTLQEIVNEYNVSKTAISNCLHGRCKTCAGKHWRYADEVHAG